MNGNFDNASYLISKYDLFYTDDNEIMNLLQMANSDILTREVAKLISLNFAKKWQLSVDILDQIKQNQFFFSDIDLIIEKDENFIFVNIESTYYNFWTVKQNEDFGKQIKVIWRDLLPF